MRRWPLCDQPTTGAASQASGNTKTKLGPTAASQVHQGSPHLLPPPLAAHDREEHLERDHQHNRRRRLPTRLELRLTERVGHQGILADTRRHQGLRRPHDEHCAPRSAAAVRVSGRRSGRPRRQPSTRLATTRELRALRPDEAGGRARSRQRHEPTDGEGRPGEEHRDRGAFEERSRELDRAQREGHQQKDQSAHRSAQAQVRDSREDQRSRNHRQGSSGREG